MPIQTSQPLLTFVPRNDFVADEECLGLLIAKVDDLPITHRDCFHERGYLPTRAVVRCSQDNVS